MSSGGGEPPAAPLGGGGAATQPAAPAAAEAAKVAGWKQIAAGTVGGVCQVLTGHPFNTVKARIQSSSTPTSGMAVLKDLMKHEGPRGLYKGMGSPLVGTGVMCAVVFHANGAALNAFAGVDDPSRTDDVPLSLVAAAGATAGAMQVGVCTPIELVMIRLQTQHTLSPGKPLYAGPIDCAAKIVRAGGVSGLYKGFGATMLRDIPNYFSYFMVRRSAPRACPPGRACGGGAAAALVWVPALTPLPSRAVRARRWPVPRPLSAADWTRWIPPAPPHAKRRPSAAASLAPTLAASPLLLCRAATRGTR